MDKIYIKLGNIIRHYRKSKNYSTAEIAEKLNISAGLINNLENGRNDVFKLELLSDFFTELNIPIEELFELIPTNLKLIYFENKHLHIQKNNWESNENIELIKYNLDFIIKYYINTVYEYNCNKDAVENITKNIIINLETIKNLNRI